MAPMLVLAQTLAWSFYVWLVWLVVVVVVYYVASPMTSMRSPRTKLILPRFRCYSLN